MQDSEQYVGATGILPIVINPAMQNAIEVEYLNKSGKLLEEKETI